MKMMGIITGFLFRLNRKESIQIQKAVSEGIWDTFREMGYETLAPCKIGIAMHTPPKPVEEFLNHSK